MVFQTCDLFPERNGYILGIIMPNFWVEVEDLLTYNKCYISRNALAYMYVPRMH